MTTFAGVRFDMTMRAQSDGMNRPGFAGVSIL